MLILLSNITMTDAFICLRPSILNKFNSNTYLKYNPHRSSK